MKRQVLFVDGYNMIGAWPILDQLKKQDKLADARDTLLSMLSNYAKYEGIEVIVVFDAQFVPGIQQTYNEFGVTVIFTKEEETADTYIEREAAERINPLTHVRVATSDMAEQWIIFSKGALRVSARELYKNLKESEKKIRSDAEDYQFQSYRRNSPWSNDQLKKLQEIYNDLD
ncbi:NYN domain-containing protein [Vagococcus carniphilus]|uniref:DNA-binding protein n=1 Tax=Vagococcus carniphilus TaxID=218144 RepID=A0A430B6I4_9ENTE|nr:NYN domain-containing protein [Vagococcus carniphilus]QNN72819.1 NYN domain-containing protein [Vagococcus carniphilus]RSU15925.1 DNA-binding protein [Vagococcus carniphilus]